MSVIGIPKGLFYYKYHPLWKTFFEDVGAELVFSADTSRKTLDDGIASCVTEACLPLKAWFGHALDVKQKAELLFVPRYTSISRYEYICPKFGGLPDMARSCLPGLPPMISPEINMHDSHDGGKRAAVDCGRMLGVKKDRSLKAYDHAVQVYLKHRGAQVKEIEARSSGAEQGRPRILLLGHCYTVHDGGINMNIAGKLNRQGLEVITLEAYDSRALRQAAGGLEKPLFWNYGTQALGCAALLAQRPVEGVIYLTCFGCGVDSFVGYMVERRVRKLGIPFAMITLDEHTGEAGLETRVEAFADTLRGRLL